MPRFRSISSLLITRIVLLAVACMVVFGGLQSWWEYRQGQKNFKHSMETLADNSMLLLSNALWDIDPSIVKKQVLWLANLPEVGHVRVRTMTTGEVFEAGNPVEGRMPALSLPIQPPIQSTDNLQLGVLEIWEDRSYYLEVLWNSTLRVLLGYGLFTALVCFMVAVVMRRELRQPLYQIARFASSLKPNELSRPLVLDRPERAELDEIDLVIQGFQQLQHDLRGYIDHLDLLVAERTEQLETLVDEVKRLSLTDSLTGCYNRRALDERMAGELERSKRYGRPLSVIFVDVDHFKRVNDVHGHAAGDAVLREVALRCQSQLRSQVDWIVRYGGEEFLIVLPESQAAEAQQLALRLGQAIKEQAIHVYELSLSITASFGVTQLDGDEDAETMLARADAMLYEAKHAGRDCVRVAYAKKQVNVPVEGGIDEPTKAALTDEQV